MEKEKSFREMTEEEIEQVYGEKLKAEKRVKKKKRKFIPGGLTGLHKRLEVSKGFRGDLKKIIKIKKAP